MAFAVLPIQGAAFLCRVDGGTIEPLEQCPGGAKALRVIADDASTLAILTRDRTRAGLFALRAEAPWLVPLLPFTELPNRCFGHVVASVRDTLITGGHGQSGEALWCRHGGGDAMWREVELPTYMRRAGKAVDGLLFSGDRLIVIDDIVMPKWILEYEIAGDGVFSLTRTRQLPFHTTYERIHHAAIGAPGIGLLSRGINHGTVSGHAWVLDVESFTQLRHAGARSGGWRRCIGRKPTVRDRAILRAREVAFVRNIMVAACGRRGIIVADVPQPDRGSTRLRCGSIPFRPLRHVPLHTVSHLVVPKPLIDDGLFAVGRSWDGSRSAVWLPHEMLSHAGR